jgi:solute carrier family 25 (mitochondrial citrate transporter), member 1
MAPAAKVDPIVSMLTGSICGGIECIVVWPTENIKTQLQLQGRVKEPKFTSFSGGVRYVVGNHGVMALYKGLPPILIGVLPKSGIRFGSQAVIKQQLQDSGANIPSAMIDLLSGIGAGVAEAVLAATPMETVKTKTIEVCRVVEC